MSSSSSSAQENEMLSPPPTPTPRYDQEEEDIEDLALFLPNQQSLKAEETFVGDETKRVEITPKQEEGEDVPPTLHCQLPIEDDERECAFLQVDLDSFSNESFLCIYLGKSLDGTAGIPREGRVLKLPLQLPIKKDDEKQSSSNSSPSSSASSSSSISSTATSSDSDSSFSPPDPTPTRNKNKQRQSKKRKFEEPKERVGVAISHPHKKLKKSISPERSVKKPKLSSSSSFTSKSKSNLRPEKSKRRPLIMRPKKEPDEPKLLKNYEIQKNKERQLGIKPQKVREGSGSAPSATATTTTTTSSFTSSFKIPKKKDPERAKLCKYTSILKLVPGAFIPKEDATSELRESRKIRFILPKGHREEHERKKRSDVERDRPRKILTDPAQVNKELKESDKKKIEEADLLFFPDTVSSSTPSPQISKTKAAVKEFPLPLPLHHENGGDSKMEGQCTGGEAEAEGRVLTT